MKLPFGVIEQDAVHFCLTSLSRLARSTKYDLKRILLIWNSDKNDTIEVG